MIAFTPEIQKEMDEYVNLSPIISRIENMILETGVSLWDIRKAVDFISELNQVSQTAKEEQWGLS